MFEKKEATPRFEDATNFFDRPLDSDNATQHPGTDDGIDRGRERTLSSRAGEEIGLGSRSAWRSHRFDDLFDRFYNPIGLAIRDENPTPSKML